MMDWIDWVSTEFGQWVWVEGRGTVRLRHGLFKMNIYTFQQFVELDLLKFVGQKNIGEATYRECERLQHRVIDENIAQYPPEKTEIAALQAQLKAAGDTVAEVKAENERLRTAIARAVDAVLGIPKHCTVSEGAELDCKSNAAILKRAITPQTGD